MIEIILVILSILIVKGFAENKGETRNKPNEKNPPSYNPPEESQNNSAKFKANKPQKPKSTHSNKAKTTIFPEHFDNEGKKANVNAKSKIATQIKKHFPKVSLFDDDLPPSHEYYLDQEAHIPHEILLEFSKDQSIDLLELHEWAFAMMRGDITPTNNAQSRFRDVALKRREPTTDFEYTWKQFLLIRNTTSVL